ncbi:sugar ABC transporter ATP-binding protein [Cocleimonas flava]|uniref:Monosaccharide ABC transporter ATP-binding protein (CUT2 family) n=1 Tax=Cocleimonas flava TaxID=634765 RepID=A0A4R1ETP4_9GAMM|nr:sugar ABC transporter ATP-binding protein [Cocleimonas flava]TCJ85016.1 monosaccharide ABC transporter ATP-binding protein (CUT2 family) [Cocleimonas flava]
MNSKSQLLSDSVKEGETLLRVEGVSKRFPGVLALDNVSFNLKAGEVHVLFGENGAGKSTMISMIAGVHTPTSGEIRFRGEPVDLKSVRYARSLGISAVFQEFSLVGQLNVEQNLFLGDERVKNKILRKKELHIEAEKILKDLGFDLKPSQIVSYLSRAEQQMVEIAKAFRSEVSVLILDEPTASLTERETDQLFRLVEMLKAQGVGVIYITHRMAEIRRIADRITVLRDGKYVDTVDAKSTTESNLINLMTGRVVGEIFPKIDFKPKDKILSIENLSTKNHRIKDVSVHVSPGEIVGLAGLVGAGKSALIRACFGIQSVSSGKVIFDGEDVTNMTTRQMLDKGFFYSPPDRKGEGLVMIRSCQENISLPSLHLPKFNKWNLLRRSHELKETLSLATKLQLHPLKINREVEHFSGGNQQKVLLAKCLTRDVKLFVFDEPTVGVDVGTRVEIYKFIAKLCEEGAAVIIISSDLPEVINMSHRLYVMHRGKLQTELRGDEITQENVLMNFFDKEVA